ncbi:MAG: hypothetical protein AAGF30_10055 [Pseudomonadota bacterium]
MIAAALAWAKQDDSPFAKVLNRFGLIIVWLGVILFWHHFFDDSFFLSNFFWLVASGVLLGGISGYLSYSAFVPDHHKNHSGAAVIVWGGGVLLACIVGFLATLLVQASECVVSMTNSENLKVALLDPDCKEQQIVRLYSALQPWQTGIGATIGLLGLAWSTMYRSVYEDWIKHQPAEANS